MLFILKKPARIKTDALNKGISAYIFQQNKKKYSIIYISRKITPAELNYNIYNKELLAIVMVFKK